MLGRIRPEHFSLKEHKGYWAQLLKGKTPTVNYNAQTLSADKVADAIKALQEQAGLRQAGIVCRQTLENIEERSMTPEQCLRRFASSAVSIGVPAESTAISTAEWIDGAIKEADKRKLNPPYYDLGFPQINDAVRAEDKHLMIISADSGKGKTTVALNIAKNLGVDQKIPTLFLNLEMEWFSVAFRLIAMEAGISLTDLSRGDVNSGDLKKKLAATRSGKLYITDALPWADLSEIMALTREYVATSGVKVVILDYIQRLENTSHKEDYKFLLDAAKSLKSLAQELSIFVIMIAQSTDDGFLAGAKGMRRDADSWITLEREGIEGNGTHTVQFPKARHAPECPSIPLIIDDTTLKVYELGSPVEAESKEAKQAEPQVQLF